MLSFKNIYEFIDYLPKYMIPYEYLDICWYIKMRYNEDFKIITPNEVIVNLTNIFGKFNSPKKNKIKNKLNNYIEYLKNNPKIRILRSGKILFNKEEIPEDLFECDNCGNVWDGNAQCNCYLYSNEFGEFLYLI